VSEVRRIYEAMAANIDLAAKDGEDIVLQGLVTIRSDVHSNWLGTGERKHVLRCNISPTLRQRINKPRESVIESLARSEAKGLQPKPFIYT
jgi:hypothetical protein